MLDYLDDIEADLSAWHRVDDMRWMPARRWCVLVYRLAAYSGVMQARVLNEQNESGQGPESAGRAHGRNEPVTRDAVHNSPALSKLIDFA